MHQRDRGTTSGSGSRRQTAVVIDRERLWREAVTQVLRRTGVEVIAREETMRAGLRSLRESRPDLLVVGLSGPEDDFQATEFLRRTRSLGSSKVIVLSDLDDPDAARRALASGAIAYVVKSEELSDLVFAVRQTLHRSIYLSSDESEGAKLESERRSAEMLTKREREIVWLVAEGYSNPEIAQRLWVTQQTVKFHLSNTFRKLDVSGRAEAAEWARGQGATALKNREAPH
jgi:NarL family two-component system response regulator LiaR